MKRLFVSVGIGLIATVLLSVAAGIGGGACHCSSPLQLLFPFVSMLGIHAEWGIEATMLFVLQFPAYAVILAFAFASKKAAWPLGAVLMLMVIHVVAAAIALQVS